MDHFLLLTRTTEPSVALLGLQFLDWNFKTVYCYLKIQSAAFSINDLSISLKYFLPDSIKTVKGFGAILYVILISVFHLEILLCLKWSVPVFCNPDLANVTFTDICSVYYNMCSTDVRAFRAMSTLINYAQWTKLPYWKLCGLQAALSDLSSGIQSRMCPILLTSVDIAFVSFLKVGTQITFCVTLIWW